MEKRFRAAFLLGAVGVTLLMTLIVLLMTGGVPRDQRTVQALLPAAPAALLLVCVLVAFRQLDERERETHRQAFAWAFVSAALVFGAYGVGQVVLALPALNLALASAFMLCLWGAAWLVSARRLR